MGKDGTKRLLVEGPLQINGGGKGSQMAGNGGFGFNGGNVSGYGGCI